MMTGTATVTITVKSTVLRTGISAVRVDRKVNGNDDDGDNGDENANVNGNESGSVNGTDTGTGRNLGEKG